MIEIPIQIVAEALGAGGIFTTIFGSVKQWLSRSRSRDITVTLSTSEGRNIVLDSDDIQRKSPEELQALIASLIPEVSDDGGVDISTVQGEERKGEFRKSKDDGIDEKR
jgi:Effector Associated Constant Component 1